MSNESSTLPYSVGEAKWAKFEICDDQPYQRYEAVPLISCAAYLFRYTTKDNRQMAIFYHAKSGIPQELGEIVDAIDSDGVPLTEVSLFVASSDITAVHGKAIAFTSQKRNELFKRYGFPEENCIIQDEGYPCYCVDTQGNHGINITRKNTLSQQQSSTDQYVLLQDSLETKQEQRKPGFFNSKSNAQNDDALPAKGCCEALKKIFGC